MRVQAKSVSALRTQIWKLAEDEVDGEEETLPNIESIVGDEVE